MNRSEATYQGTVLVPGAARGSALVLSEPLSLWGGLDPQTGEIIDRRHPESGHIVSGKILVLPAGRGSSSASSVLLEAARAHRAPNAIITLERDAILALGAAVARELYAVSLPVIVLPQVAYERIHTLDLIHIDESGMVTIQEEPQRAVRKRVDSSP